MASSPALTEQERNTIIPVTQPWDDAYAKKIALAQFLKMETFRTQNHDRRFQTSDQLYLAWTQRKTWEGSKVPRSSVPIFMALQEIEILLGRVLAAIFSDNPPFDAVPESSSTTIQQAWQIKQLLRSQCRNLGEDGKFRTLREICRRTYKQSLKYGNGIVEFGWLLNKYQRPVFEIYPKPKTVTIMHPVTGEPVAVPSGEIDMVPVRTMQQCQTSRPQVIPVDIRDFYIDPLTSSASVQDARDCGARTFRSINDIKLWSYLPGFNVPNDAMLLELAHKKKNTVGDNSKQAAEGYRGNTFQPTNDYSDDPNQQNLEIIRYFQRDRTVWLLGREHVVYNQPNAYEMLPFINAFYLDMDGRFYGLSVSDLVEGDQKLASAIINNRIDELNLLLHAPILKKRGTFQNSSSKRMHPGAEWEVANVEDVKRLELGTVNPAAFAELNALDLRVQKLTGNTDLAATGTGTMGGNSANRTAAGINTQTSASNTRVQHHVENFEDQFMEPLLYSLLALNKRFLDPAQAISIIGDQNLPISIDPLAILNADVSFEVQASNKMRMKQQLASGGLQMLTELGLNPVLMQELAKIGKTIDVETIIGIILDFLSVPSKSVVRDLTPQEQQMMQQPPMQALMELQKQRERLQAGAEKQTNIDDTKLLNSLVQKLLTPATAHTVLGITSDPAAPEPTSHD